MNSSDKKNPDSEAAIRGLLPLKQLNARISLMQNVTQDYSQDMMPQWIGFTTTTFCNLRCPHCQTHGTKELQEIYNAKRWPVNLLTNLGKETLPYAFEFSLSLNGEPLATPYLKQRLREFRKYGAKMHLTTNGTLLSKKTIVRVLPLASTIAISIDGATERTCEAIRLGSNFKKLIYNIKLLAAARALLPGEIAAPDLRLAFTVMTSNVKEMPEMVRLAHFLNVPAIDFYNLEIFFSHVRNEDLKLYKPLYNAYYERTQNEADRLKIAVYMPKPFPDVAPDATVKVEGPDLILGQLPEDYYDNLPPLETYLDMGAVESEASEIVARIIEEQDRDKETINGEDSSDQAKIRLEGSLKTLLVRHRSELDNISGEEIPYCENLFRRTFVNSEGDVSPCCIPGRPVLGNVNNNTMSEIYNGELYGEFRRRFFSSNPPDICKECRYFISVPKQELLHQIGVPRVVDYRFREGVVINAMNIPLKRDQKRLIGAIDLIDDRIPGVLQLAGWIGDRATWQPPRAYIVTHREGEHLLHPSEFRPDLASINEELRYAGFNTSIPLRGEPFQRDELKVLVVFDEDTYAEMDVQKEGLQ